MYQTFKSEVLKAPAHPVGDGQCVAIDRAYLAALFPGVDSYSILPSVDGAKQLAGHSSQYLTWVVNDHTNPNQVPPQGAIMVFDETPQTGYTNTFVNPFGHTGVCDSATANGYALLQQNAPETGEGPNVTSYAWKFRPCLGWYLIAGQAPAPNPTPTPAPTTGHTITLPKTTGPWHLYKEGQAGNKNEVLGIINPIALGRDLTYAIIASLGNGVYRIQSTDYGVGDLWTRGSDVIIK